MFGEPEANVSIEQHAFGLWLSEDMGCVKNTQKLIEKVEALLKKNAPAFTFNSAQYVITIDRDSVELQSNNRSDDLESIDAFSDVVESDDEFQLSDDNHCAHCGPEDFYALLQSWESYL